MASKYASILDATYELIESMDHGTRACAEININCDYEKARELNLRDSEIVAYQKRFTRLLIQGMHLDRHLKIESLNPSKIVISDPLRMEATTFNPFWKEVLQKGFDEAKNVALEQLGDPDEHSLNGMSKSYLAREAKRRKTPQDREPGC